LDGAFVVDGVALDSAGVVGGAVVVKDNEEGDAAGVGEGAAFVAGDGVALDSAGVVDVSVVADGTAARVGVGFIVGDGTEVVEGALGIDIDSAGVVDFSEVVDGAVAGEIAIVGESNTLWDF